MNPKVRRKLNVASMLREYGGHLKGETHERGSGSSAGRRPVHEVVLGPVRKNHLPFWRRENCLAPSAQTLLMVQSTFPTI